MSERDASWWDYVKAAFRFRFPVRWLGALPVNQLCLLAGAVFTALFLLARQPAPAAGVVLLTAAFELLYLNLMTSLPRFRQMVRANLFEERHAASSASTHDLVRQLSKVGLQRYQRMGMMCEQIEGLLSERQEGDDSWGDALKTGGLTDIQTMFLRLLLHQERTQTYLAGRAVADLPREIQAVETELKSKQLLEAVRHSRQQTLEVLKQRQAMIQRMVQSCELSAAELDRLEQHVALLRDQAASGDPVPGMVDQIDSVVEGLSDATGWLLDSERMLGEAPAATQEVSVKAD